MKRNLIIIAIAFVIIIALMITGNIITVGEKLTQLTGCVYLEYGLYLLLTSLFVIFIILPIVKVHRTPIIPKLSIEENCNAESLLKFAEQLSRNMDYIPDKEKKISHSLEFQRLVSDCTCNFEGMKSVVQKELDNRFNGNEVLGSVGINDKIKEWAKTVLIITALSQNNKFDSLSVMYMNYRMINDIICASGFRPDNRQMFKIYKKILYTALFAYCVSSTLNKIGSSALGVSGIDDTDGSSIYTLIRRIPIPNKLMGSVIDGILNALMTLRIGYITRTYLQKGAVAFDGDNNMEIVKRQAMKNAALAVPSVIFSAGHVVGEKITDHILNVILKNNASRKEDYQQESI